MICKIVQARCKKKYDAYGDGYFVFTKGQEVELVKGYKEDYAIWTPFGKIDIDIEDGHWELIKPSSK